MLSEIFRYSKLESRYSYRTCDKLSIINSENQGSLALNRKIETILPQFYQRAAFYAGQYRNRSIRSRISANSFLLSAASAI